MFPCIIHDRIRSIHNLIRCMIQKSTISILNSIYNLTTFIAFHVSVRPLINIYLFIDEVCGLVFFPIRLAHPGGPLTTNKAAALAKFLERKLQDPNGLDSLKPELLELAVKNAKATVNASNY